MQISIDFPPFRHILYEKVLLMWTIEIAEIPSSLVLLLSLPSSYGGARRAGSKRAKPTC